MAQIAVLTGLTVPFNAATGDAFAHGLVRAPNLIGFLHGTGANIQLGTTPSTDTNIYIHNATPGPENAEVLVMAIHSLADGTNQAVRVSTTIPVGNEEAVAHGLVRAPSIVALLHGTGANITPGATAPDADNVYLDNAGGGVEAVELLVMAPHSIIA